MKIDHDVFIRFDLSNAVRAANTTETRIEERFAHEPKSYPSQENRPTMKKTSETRATRLTTRRLCRKNSCATVRDKRLRGELQMRDSVDCLSLLSGMSSHPTWRPQGWSGHSTQPDVKFKRCVVGQAKMPTSLKTHAVTNNAGVFMSR